MGTVSTALSEESLSKCLKKSIYEDENVRCEGEEEDDVKCSICQVLFYINFPHSGCDCSST